MSEERKRKQEKLFEPSGDHLFISPEIIQRKTAARRPKSQKERRVWVPPKKAVSELKEEALRVLKHSDSKQKVIPDPYVYFVLSLTTSFGSPAIARFLERSKTKPVDFIGDKIAKVRVLRGDYQTFLMSLEDFQRYVDEIRESTQSERLDEELLKTIERQPNKLVQVDIEISQLPGSELISETRRELESYLHARDLVIDESYTGDNFLLLSGELPATTVKEIAQNLDAISKIHLSHPFELQTPRSKPNVRRKRVLRLSSIDLTPIPSSRLPVVCIVDSGVNRDHSYLKPYVLDTYDLTTNSSFPCSDSVGHGSAVAGMAVYEGDIQTPAKSSIVAVKLTDVRQFSTKPLKSLEFIVKKFKGMTKIFNLSFSSLGPNLAKSRAIDDLAYKENVLFVVSAGNIDKQEIMDDLNNGASYPDYLLEHHVYCPGDCFNALTIGSYANKKSNIASQDWPSPFTRSRRPAMSALKPELLGPGGNMDAIRLQDKIVKLESGGIGVRCTSNNDSTFVEGTGTSLSAPVVASMVAGLTSKFTGKRICFYKALIISSAEPLSNKGAGFDAYIQGFGVPNRSYALVSPYSRTNLVADSYFDLSDLTVGHRYTFYFPQKADRIRVTVCFDVEPLVKAQELPYEIEVKLRKAATRDTTYAKADEIVPSGRSNSKVFEFRVVRAGIGDWTIELYPKTTGILRGGLLSQKRLHYSVVVTVFSSKGRAVYNDVKRYTRLAAVGPMS